MKLSDVSLQGSTHRCPNCEGWQLLKRRRRGHIKCDTCGNTCSPEDLLDETEDIDPTSERERHRRHTEPTVGPAAKLIEMDASDVGGGSA